MHTIRYIYVIAVTSRSLLASSKFFIFKEFDNGPPPPPPPLVELAEEFSERGRAVVPVVPVLLEYSSVRSVRLESSFNDE